MATKSKKIKQIDRLTQEWSINVDKEDINKTVEEELKKIQARVHLDGYRKGHAPVDVLKKQYGDEVLRRACAIEVGKVSDNIIKEENFNLAFRPEVLLKDDFEFDKDINVVVRFTLKPNIKKLDYSKINIDAYELELSEEDKQEEMDRFKGKMAKHELCKEEKIIEKGDLVDIDFVGKTEPDMVEFPYGSAKGYKLEIGSKAFVDGFEEQIIGHKKGEIFDIKVQFPEVYHSTDLAGKKAIFTITINDVYIKKIPEMNDEFAKGLGFENMEKVRELLFQNLKNVYESQMKGLIKEKLFDSVILQNKFDLPETFIEREAVQRLDEAKEKFEKEHENDEKEGKKKEKFDEKKMKEKIIQNLNLSYSVFYLVDYIAREQSIKVSEDEIKQTVTQDAIRGGLDIQKSLDEVAKDEKLHNYVAFSIQEAKVFEYVYNQVNKNIKKVNRKEFETKIKEEREKQVNSANK